MAGYGKQPRPSHSWSLPHGESPSPRRLPEHWSTPVLTASPGYDGSRSFSESYAEASSAFALQPPVTTVSAVNAAAFENASLMTAAIDYAQQARIPYDDQAGPYLNVGSTPTPQVMSYRPARGAKGATLEVYISSLYELVTTNVPTVVLLFASLRCPASLSKIDQHGGVCQYVVSAVVPSFASTEWQSLQVPVSLLMESGDGELICRVDVGGFSYGEPAEPETRRSQEASRKRKFSLESAELMRSPAKRAASSHQLRPKEELGSYGYVDSDDVSYAHYLQPSPPYSIIQQYDRTLGAYQPQHAPRAVSQYPYAHSSTASTPNVKAQSPQVSTWSPYSAVSSQVPQSPSLGGAAAAAAAAARPALSDLPSPLPANPPLIRTSTLQQTPSPGTTPAGSQASAQAFNPYMHYPHKAVLKIIGDLDAMAEHWSVDEWAVGRRIVQFKRSQSGCTISTTFAPVSADERPPSSICVSCIFWEDKNECFVTSVDTIYLLEQLIAARFTVEEKNRIRRNLEGFRPLTVSKAKQDSEEFFKLIMGFPNPKPRNIEKDVKVFPWKILVHALKKIIGKYSASPSSTLPPPLATPASSTGYATEGSSGLSHAGGDQNNLLSPPRSISHSISGASASAPAGPCEPNKTFSPPGRRPTMTLSNGVPPDARFSVPDYHVKQEPSHPWPGSPPYYAPRFPYQHGGGGYPTARGSYDLSSFLDTSPATAPASAATPGHGPGQPSSYSSSSNNGGGGGGGGHGSRLATSAVEAGGGRSSQARSSQQMPTS